MKPVPVQRAHALETTAAEAMRISKPLIVSGQLTFTLFLWCTALALVVRFGVHDLLNPTILSTFITCAYSTVSMVWMYYAGILSPRHSSYKQLYFSNMLCKWLFEFGHGHFDYVLQLHEFSLPASPFNLFIQRTMTNIMCAVLPQEQPHFFATSRLFTLPVASVLALHTRGELGTLSFFGHITGTVFWAGVFILSDTLFLAICCLFQPTSQEFTTADLDIPIPCCLRNFVDAWVSAVFRAVGFLRPPESMLGSFSYSDFVVCFLCGINWALIENNMGGLSLQRIVPIGLGGVFGAMLQTYLASLSLNWIGKAAQVEREEAWANFSRRIMQPGRNSKIEFTNTIRQFLGSLGVDITRSFILYTRPSDPNQSYCRKDEVPFEVIWIQHDLMDLFAPSVADRRSNSSDGPLASTSQAESRRSAELAGGSGSRRSIDITGKRWRTDRDHTPPPGSVTNQPHPRGLSRFAGPSFRHRTSGDRAPPLERIGAKSVVELESLLGLNAHKKMIKAGRSAVKVHEGTSYIQLQAGAAQNAVLDSDLEVDGMNSFVDWKKAAALDTKRALVVPIVAGDQSFGTLHIHLAHINELIDHSVLLKLADTLAIVVKQRTLTAVNMILSDLMPSHVVDKMAARRTSMTLGRPTTRPPSGHPSQFEPSESSHSRKNILEHESSRLRPQGPDSEDDPGLALEMLETFSDCTVISCDVKGYTAACSDTDPLTCMRSLHELYVKFDALSAQYGVYKLDVVGDAFIGAVNLFKFDPDHARTAIRFATELHKSTVGMTLGEHPLSIRIGLATGPLTGSVIGKIRKKFVAYGAVLSVAQRLESTGAPGYLHIARSTLESARLRSNTPGLTERLIRLYTPVTSAFGLKRTRPYDYLVSYFFRGDNSAETESLLAWGSENVGERADPKEGGEFIPSSHRPSFMNVQPSPSR